MIKEANCKSEGGWKARCAAAAVEQLELFMCELAESDCRPFSVLGVVINYLRL